MTLIEFIHDKLSDERNTRADIPSINSYAAGFSDGAIEALNDVQNFYLRIGEYAGVPE